MDQAEFTRIFAQRPQQFAWFIGAGTSRSAGLPTATDIIWDLKRRYYRSEEKQDVSTQDLQNSAVKERIQAFVDSKGFPAQWAENEYTTYFEKIFGEDKERQRQYLRAILSEDKVTLSAGNRVLGAMMQTGFCRAVFTTNFDSVVEKSIATMTGSSIAAYHLEGPANARKAFANEEYPFYCKLHGDFRFDSVKNLSTDLKEQNSELSGCFTDAAARFGFIVAGYSGRDQSVMDLFHSALKTGNPFPHGLYWLGMKGSAIPPIVATLIEEAKKNKVDAHYIEIETFDAIMLRVWRNLDGKPAGIDDKVKKASVSAVNISLPPVGKNKPPIRFNALPIHALPTQCFALSLKNAVEWREVKDKQKANEGEFIFTIADQLLCWGEEANLRRIFALQLNSISPFSLPVNLDGAGNLGIKALVEEGLARALVSDKPLLSRTTRYDNWIIADPAASDVTALSPLKGVTNQFAGKISGLFTQPTVENPKAEQVQWAEAVRISLDIRDGRAWLVLDPDIWIWPRFSRKDAIEFLDDRISDRFNQKYNDILDAWIQILTGGSKNPTFTVSTFQSGASVENPSYNIGTRSAFSSRLTA